MITLPNGETWTNGGENTFLAIAWVRDMFHNATDRNLEPRLSNGYECQLDALGWYHSKIMCYTFIISTPTRYTNTVDYIIDGTES